jgi:pyridoxal phosphate enzyme (YggS family)
MMNSITRNISALVRELPGNVTIVAVSKTRTPEEVMEAFNAGLHTFGENRVQELTSKKAMLPEGINWHLIGHLQSNKVRQAVAAASMIESVDSLRILRMIDSEAARQQKAVDCLLQVHIALEETKTGFGIGEIEETDWTTITGSLSRVRICGLMGIASLTDDIDRVRSEFRSLARLFHETRHRCFSDCSWFKEISMGMSGDWRIAVEEGSTIIRVGTLIFGERINR